MREKVRDGDRAARGNGASRGVLPDSDGGLLEGRDEVSDGLGDADLALFDEGHNDRAGDRLGLRSDTENRGRSHAAAGFLIAPADRALIDGRAVAEYQCDS